MRAVLAAAGTRGDAAPFAALAARLQGAGHEAVLLTHESLLLALPPDLPSVGVASDPHRLLAGPGGRALRRVDPIGLNRARGEFAAFVSSFAEPADAVLDGADVLVASTFAIGAVDAARRRGIPVVRVHQWPEGTGLGGPMPLLPYSWRLPAPLRRALRGGLRRAEPFLGGFDGGLRRGRLRLRPHHPVGLTTATHGTLLAVSPRLLPAGPPGTAVTGWWWEDGAVGGGTAGADSAGLDPALRTALDGPGTWVSLGFGSMPQASAEALRELVARAARAVGVRVVLQLPGSGAEGAEGIDDDGTVLGIGAVPHAALFPRLALAVHHGGAGTTGAAARAGVSTVVVPHVADQFYWGHRAHAVGVAPRPLPRALLTADALARRLEQGLREPRRRRAAALGEAVRGEDGTGAAVAHLERVLPRGAA